MRKLSILFLLAVATSMYAKTLRVNNVKGSTAPYSTVAAALEDAVDGDVIMVDASADSYGDIVINKKITLQGPGFDLVVNGMTQEGQNTASFSNITISGEGAKVSSLSSDYINAEGATNTVITRCRVRNLSIGSHNVIHQNFIYDRILFNEKSVITYSSITNNIIRLNINDYFVAKHSMIKFNTFPNRYTLFNCSDCVIENNIGIFRVSTAENTFVNNKECPLDYYYSIENDAKFKELDEALTTSCGAFAGDDPYRISGIATGPVVEDIDVPASVEQGSDLKVKVTIVTKK